MGQAWACEVERAFGIENRGIESRYGTARLAEQHQRSARPQRAQAFVEGGAANGIVDYVDAAPSCKTPRFGCEILPGIENDLIGAVLAGNPSLFFRGDRAEYARAQHLRHLH